METTGNTLSRNSAADDLRSAGLIVYRTEQPRLVVYTQADEDLLIECGFAPRPEMVREQA
jgi:hypothetical protein